MRSFYRSLLVTLAICSLIIFVATGQVWATAFLTEANSPNLIYEFTGRQIQPIIAGLVVVPVTGVVGLIAAKKIFQKIVGFSIFCAGLGIAFFAVQVSRDWPSVIDPLVTNQVGRTGIDYAYETNAYNTVLILPALGIAAIGLIFTVRNFDSAKKKAAYDLPVAGVSTLTPWQALDSGIDPTISVTDSGAGEATGSSFS